MYYFFREMSFKPASTGSSNTPIDNILISTLYSRSRIRRLVQLRHGCGNSTLQT